MTKLLLVGCGKMGGALLAGWLDNGMPADNIVVADPVGAPGRLENGVLCIADASGLPGGFVPDVVVLAVKPQMMDKAAPAYAGFAGQAVFLSIAAGKTIGYYQKMFGPKVAVVRAMPNTPAAARRGMTVMVANSAVTPGQRRLCNSLLSAVGEVAQVEDEALIDAVTAVSGSGPAYVFLLAETLAQAGVEAGLPADLAQRLARVTVAGSGALLAREDADAAQLRRDVTSPQGTTAAALDVLMGEGGFAPLLSRAVAAAAKRSRELAG